LAHCHLLGFSSSVSSLVTSPPNASPGFFFNCELTDYITTWCISWVFVISLTVSPPDASLGFLWFHWLHHHLMHLLGFCDLTGSITTWCFIIVTSCTWGCQHPLTNAKVRKKGAVRYTTFG
jgi:hypothetical protein